MAQWTSGSGAAYSGAGPVVNFSAAGDTNFVLNDNDPPPDIQFVVGEQFQGTFLVFQGTYTYLGQVFVVAFDTVSYSLFSSKDLADVTYPPSFDIGDIDPSPFTVCFAPGTKIASPRGTRNVEDLSIGELIATEDGRVVPVKWIGRQTIPTLFRRHQVAPVRICAGALGKGLPHTDLTVTADHGMIIDGFVINASALVNCGSIDFVPTAELPAELVVYHIETEAHDVILANGAPAETFCDIPGRMAFDNYQEYLDFYGAERIIPEMDRPRIASRRLLPDAIKARLGIVDAVIDFDMPLSA